jgi:c(7)-type cytochrome triheme protein
MRARRNIFMKQLILWRGSLGVCVVSLVAIALSPTLVTFAETADYSKFSHSSPTEHANLMGRNNCGSCHRRNGVAAEPALPLHRDCTGCHLVQFTSANSGSPVNPICTICHQAEGLISPQAPRKRLSRLMSFGADFDHAQHLQIESAKPPKGCAACHVPMNRGVAESIPTGLNAHRICYECHSPGRPASDYSSCGSCHGVRRYAPTSTVARSYRSGFSHADHTARVHLNCERCHEVRPRGFPQRRQVTSIALVQHLPNARGCVSCHNGQRAFGEHHDGNFENCRRCHAGIKFGS